MRSLASFLLPMVLVLLGELFAMSHAFATWLQCYLDLDDTEVVMNHKILSPEEAPHLVTVQVRPADAAPDNEWLSTFEYPAGVTTRLHVIIKPPPEVDSRVLQWVMDTTEGAKFIRPAVCEGSRTNGGNQKEYAVLEINGDTESIAVWAGWAGGHEAVSLTPKITLTRSTTASVEL
jgi:hypothetical protein